MRLENVLLLCALSVAGCAEFHRAGPSPLRAGISHQVLQKNDTNGVLTWAVLPSSYSETQPSPWIIYDHGFGETIESILQNDPQSSFVNELVSAGFVVVASQYRNLACWGDKECTEDVANLQTLWRSQLNLTPKPFVIGESMGGIVTWNAVSHGTLSPAAVVGIYPACNLAAMYQNSTFAPTIQSAFGFSSQTQYAGSTNGYDPMTTPPSTFAAFPITIWSSYSDHVVVRKLNEDPFARAIRAAGGTVIIYSSVGEHGDASSFDSEKVAAFFRANLMLTKL